MGPNQSSLSLVAVETLLCSNKRIYPKMKSVVSVANNTVCSTISPKKAVNDAVKYLVIK